MQRRSGCDCEMIAAKLPFAKHLVKEVTIWTQKRRNFNG